jgi:hypothetical protein
MKQVEKVREVLNYLYRNRSNGKSTSEIHENLSKTLLESEIESILEDLNGYGIVDEKSVCDVEGFELPFYEYKLTSFGIILIEETIAKDQEKSSNQIDIKLKRLQQEPNIKEPNPYPAIFKNQFAFKLFEEIQSLTLNEKTKVADYAFIYHKLKHKSLQAIHSNVTQPKFIEFLNTNYDAQLVVTKLPFNNPQKKGTLYTKIIEKYRDLI